MSSNVTWSPPGIRRPLIGVNWKMNLTSSEASAYVGALLPLVADLVDHELFVLPPYTSIAAVRDGLSGSNVGWGAQDVHPDDWGPHTGDVSAPMLADLGCRYVEVGHWERRRDHNETDELIAAKVDAIVRWGMTPIVCVGGVERMDPASAVAASTASLGRILARRDRPRSSLIVAYEPSWAIGEGAVAATPADVGDVVRGIHAWLADERVADEEPRVIYGGSVDRNVAERLLAQDGVDGLFIGREGLDPGTFAAIAGRGRQESAPDRTLYAEL